jgi:hypothetical protein
MVPQILRNQISSVMSLSLPLMAFSYFYPWIFDSWYGICGVSLLMGLYIFYLNYKAARAYNNGLIYKPSGQVKDYLEKITRECGLNPNDLEIRYAYTQEMIGSANFNMIRLDPLLWSLITDDLEAQKAKQVLETHIVPTLSEIQRKRISAIQQIFTPGAQQFIFKHELAHVIHTFSRKKLALVGCVAALAALSGIITAQLLFPLFAGVALIIACVVAACMDLFLSYASNVVFKVRAEYYADVFAANHSSVQEIEAAAVFFEKHASILQENQDQTLLAKLPAEILSGHPSTNKRVKYLRGLVASNVITHQG